MFSPKDFLFYVTLLPVIAIFAGLAAHIFISLINESPAQYQEIPVEEWERR
ncbi:MAG: hypothetical protein ACYDCO_10615 [Armatimonadota bacterium]